MVFDAELEKAPSRELRILVLHNRDFGSESAPKDLFEASRADVANAAQDVARALAARGHFAEIQGIDYDDIADFLNQINKDPPDLVFNLIESLRGEDRHQVVIPSLLEMLGIAYTGTGPLGLGVCLDKYRTKQILRAAAIPTPGSALLPAVPRSRAEDLLLVESVGYPLFLKLALTDGSVGISGASVVHNDEAFIEQLEHLRRQYRQPILAESFIAGRELYVSVLGNDPARIFPLQEIDFGGLPDGLPQIVTEAAKWDKSSVEYKGVNSTSAAEMPEAVRARVEEVARKSFAVLDVRDYGRCDIRLSQDGTPYVIDMNANCDLSDGAGYSKAAQLAELGYDRLIEQIALLALQRNSNAHPQRQGGIEQPGGFADDVEVADDTARSSWT